MSSVEWNKKEDLLQDQALRHVKKYIPLFTAFTSNARSEMALLNKIQEYCYDNMNFLKTFNKIVLLLYKSKLVKFILDRNVPYVMHKYILQLMSCQRRSS